MIIILPQLLPYFSLMFFFKHRYEPLHYFPNECVRLAGLLSPAVACNSDQHHGSNQRQRPEERQTQRGSRPNAKFYKVLAATERPNLTCVRFGCSGAAKAMKNIVKTIKTMEIIKKTWFLQGLDVLKTQQIINGFDIFCFFFGCPSESGSGPQFYRFWIDFGSILGLRIDQKEAQK